MNHLKKFESFNSENLQRKFIWIHGLPGSGKTHLSNEISKDQKFVILDDIGNISKVVSNLDKENNIILSSPYFDNYINLGLDLKLKSILKDYDYDIDEIWFENNPENCIKNIKNRTDHKIDSVSIIPEIPNFSRNYIIPVGVKTIPVLSY